MDSSQVVTCTADAAMKQELHHIVVVQHFNQLEAT
jgi:hypothetical protein